MRSARTLLAVVAMLALAAPARAVEPDEILPDAKLEGRARMISAELRCLVCQNQSIDDSNAPLARDLRLLVRERLRAGDSDADVMKFVVARYGEFVLLRPPFQISTLILWLAPLMALAAAAALLARSGLAAARRAPQAETTPLSQAEEDVLRRILDEGKAEPKRVSEP